ncbi:MAG: hypothetical protein JSR61_02595 [Proteobacteria bacterium]|nr:hypothetical protein [Pseudomonadota bacterium]
MTLPINERDRHYLEETGVENVRIALLTNTNLALPDRGAAWRWLKEQDDQTATQKAAFDRRMFYITVVGSVAAVIAAVASLIAIWPRQTF